ncbi:MAG: DUF2062 domain-containing protein [Myxococcales bacterium]|nr:DUF2062 domain-containing protein [Myxococcales bacterium]
MNWAQRRVQRIRYLFKMALAEDTTPHEFALAVALGAFVSASPVPPVLGLRSFTTLGLAWAARLSKLVAFLASHLVIIPLWGLLVFWEIRIGCRILSRPMPPWARPRRARLGRAQRAARVRARRRAGRGSRRVRGLPRGPSAGRRLPATAGAQKRARSGGPDGDGPGATKEIVITRVFCGSGSNDTVVPGRSLARPCWMARPSSARIAADSVQG